MTTPTARKTLATYGAKGEQIRVFIERGGELVRVQWYDGAKGAKRLQTKSWPNTTANQREAKAWARGFSETRHASPAVLATATFTLRMMWERYTVAEFPHLRPRTQKGYAERWQEWERFAGRHFVAERTTLEMIDDFRRARARLGLAVNQTAEAIKVVRMVYRWAERRELITRNRVALYRFKIAKEERPKPIAEFDPSDFPKLLAQFDPRSSREWRAWAITAVCGTQGMRINAALHLRWDDVDFNARTLHWRPAYDKMGHDRVQALTQLAWEALHVCLGWAQHDGETSGWIFYSPTAKKRARGDHTYHVSAYWRMLRSAENAAGISHQPRRAAHGLRRMAAGNALALTQNPIDAMQWIGDSDLTQARRYLKERSDRQRDLAGQILVTEGTIRKRAASSTSRKHFTPTVTPPQPPPETANAPADADALTLTPAMTYAID